MLNFHYMELVKHNLQGSYMLSSGIVCYNQYGLEVSIWISMNRRNVCMVKRFYGKYDICEL